MAIAVHKYGSDITKGKSSPHPSSWGKGGTSKDYEVVKNIVLQVTDVKNNNNKFYSLELHKSKGGDHRLFSHYGRTDDLETKGDDAGTKECRYGDQWSIEREYDKIVKSKQKKGYKEVHLAKSNIGSDKAKGQSSGHIDTATINAMTKTTKKKSSKKKKSVLIDQNVRSLIETLYKEAGEALTQRANVKITADGFATPLGVLTLGQVDRGFGILSDVRRAIQNGQLSTVKELSSDFYTTIPHRIGRSRAAIEAAVISSIEKSDEAEETLQLMKDMLNINQDSDQNLFATDEVDEKYRALKTDIEFVPKSDPLWDKIRHYVNSTESSYHGRSLQVKNVYRISRHGENKAFNPKRLEDVRELFHGTRSRNVVGIMTRGLLLPNVAARHGAQITGAMFGPGLYFADQSTKSANYCGYGYNTRSSFMFIAGVALGKIKKYQSAQTQLRSPPPGYDSVMGEASVNRATWGRLVHNEYIIFNNNQQELRYIVEFEQ